MTATFASGLLEGENPCCSSQPIVSKAYIYHDLTQAPCSFAAILFSDGGYWEWSAV